MHCRKRGDLGIRQIGQLLCDGIGIPAGILEDKRILQEMLTKKVAKTGMLP